MFYESGDAKSDEKGDEPEDKKGHLSLTDRARVGMSHNDIREAFGPASFVISDSEFEIDGGYSEVWYYISRDREYFAFFADKVVANKALVIYFDASGVVRRVRVSDGVEQYKQPFTAFKRPILKKSKPI